MTTILVVAAVALALFVGFRAGMHIAMLALRQGAEHRLTAGENDELARLIGKALGGD